MVQPRGHSRRKNRQGTDSRTEEFGCFGHRRIPSQQGDPVTGTGLLNQALSASLRAYGVADLSSDPVCYPRRFADRRDAEVAAFVAASFAFGNVVQILRFLEKLFRVLGSSPHATLTASRPVSLSRVSGLSYRFLSRNGVHHFLFCVRAALLEHGSLEVLFTRGMEREEGGMRDWLAEFLARFREAWGEKIPRERDFLFPDPRKGSACKRHNMFLRWMVREDDGVDLGIWTTLRPRHLIVPLDTHMARLGNWLGLTTRNSADWRMAEEITEGFRAICPEDPVRFDFALTRIGILKACTRPVRGICSRCPIDPVCVGGTGHLRIRGKAKRAVSREEIDVAHPSPSGIDLEEMQQFPGAPGRGRENAG